MSKSILLSIKPEWVAKILNGKKTIEVRKKFPKDYVGWVYIYCTKDRKSCLHYSKEYGAFNDLVGSVEHYSTIGDGCGKVVGRFWCDKVDEIGNCSIDISYTHYTGNIYSEKEVCEGACLNWKDLGKYLKGENGYAIHISKLEIYDKPKELSEFKTRHFPQFAGFVKNKTHYELKPLTKAPQNYCYIVGEW